jgi:predicted nucleic-acid-binding Zn-ribbon protein
LESSLKSGACPKCSGQEVYIADRETDKVLPSDFRGVFGLGPTQGARPDTDNFVCGNCGYTEFYVRPADLGMVKKNWVRKEPA